MERIHGKGQLNKKNSSPLGIQRWCWSRWVKVGGGKLWQPLLYGLLVMVLMVLMMIRFRCVFQDWSCHLKRGCTDAAGVGGYDLVQEQVEGRHENHLIFYKKKTWLLNIPSLNLLNGFHFCKATVACSSAGCLGCVWSGGCCWNRSFFGCRQGKQETMQPWFHLLLWFLFSFDCLYLNPGWDSLVVDLLPKDPSVSATGNDYECVNGSSQLVRVFLRHFAISAGPTRFRQRLDDIAQRGRRMEG